jgi:uncharacterized protein YjbI with pentapeptide repeats
LRLFAVVILLVVSQFLVWSQATKARVPAPAKQPHPAVAAAQPPDTNDLSGEKTRQEIEKLRLEVAALRESNTSISYWIRTGSAIVGAIGGFLTAIVAALFGMFFQNRYSLSQDRKLKQDAQAQRETHILELCKALSEKNARLQFAAASVLIQRLQTSDSTLSAEARHIERSGIVQVLVSVLKEKRIANTTGSLNKFIADNLVKALGAVVTERHAPPEQTSVLKSGDWDFQYAKLTNCYWRGVDARGIDFFRADISKAGLREALLSGAVLMEASLEGSKLQGADLTGADLTGAKLNGADLRGAKYDSSTRWPAGFDPVMAGAVTV